ncbi:MAG: hypothetical protein HYR85_22530 [Planctomycetes bacterium]|nr:hypothetical protein [Planctomycetota bacterium]MBI3844840.1 hypothetical protein [Planctomycetota bacterium]
MGCIFKGGFVMRLRRNGSAWTTARCTAMAFGLGLLSACSNDRKNETAKQPVRESRDTTTPPKRSETAQSTTTDADRKQNAEDSAARGAEQSSSVADASLTATLVDADKKSKENTATVQVTVSGIELVDPATVDGQPKKGEGHVHYRVDDGPVVATTATKLSFRSLPPGAHRISVGLAANDHSALGTPKSITVIAGGVGAKNEHEKGEETALGEKAMESSNEPMTPPKSEAQSSDGVPSIIVSMIDQSKNARAHAASVVVKASGVDLVDPDSVDEKAKVGEGHIHYQVDDGPIVATPVAKLSFHELTPGRHTINVQLVANDHTPLTAAQTLSVEVPGGAVGD